MFNQPDHLNQFKIKIRNLITGESLRSRTIKLAKRAFVYTFGDQDAMVYYLASGQVKLLTATTEGKPCVLGIRYAGDIFGELCLSGRLSRTEAAVAMQDSRVNAVSQTTLLNLLKSESMLEDLVKYLAGHIERQQETILSLVSTNSEQRLARILLQLGIPLGAPGSNGFTIVPRISHEDLASMIGTTRSRVGLFLNNFQKNGLIRLNTDHSFTIDASKLEAFFSATTAEAKDNRPLQLAAASSGSETFEE
jgi:CRP/FNR family transcriptional regulator, cyclic AMP receptor protein